MNVQRLSPALEERLRPRVSALTIFGVIGGPLAWFTQLLAGYAMASGPCFPHDQRLLGPANSFGWTHAGIVFLLLLCTVVALAAFFVSWHGLRRLADAAFPVARRSRFIAMWGVALGAGFCIATLLTAVGIGLLPRCAG